MFGCSVVGINNELLLETSPEKLLGLQKVSFFASLFLSWVVNISA